jgi:hypothetical protein
MSSTHATIDLTENSPTSRNTSAAQALASMQPQAQSISIQANNYQQQQQQHAPTQQAQQYQQQPHQQQQRLTPPMMNYQNTSQSSYNNSNNSPIHPGIDPRLIELTRQQQRERAAAKAAAAAAAAAANGNTAPIMTQQFASPLPIGGAAYTQQYTSAILPNSRTQPQHQMAAPYMYVNQSTQSRPQQQYAPHSILTSPDDIAIQKQKQLQMQQQHQQPMHRSADMPSNLNLQQQQQYMAQQQQQRAQAPLSSPNQLPVQYVQQPMQYSNANGNTQQQGAPQSRIAPYQQAMPLPQQQQQQQRGAPLMNVTSQPGIMPPQGKPQAYMNASPNVIAQTPNIQYVQQQSQPQIQQQQQQQSQQPQQLPSHASNRPMQSNSQQHPQQQLQQSQQMQQRSAMQANLPNSSTNHNNNNNRLQQPKVSTENLQIGQRVLTYCAELQQTAQSQQRNIELQQQIALLRRQDQMNGIQNQHMSHFNDAQHCTAAFVTPPRTERFDAQTVILCVNIGISNNQSCCAH